MRIFESNKKCGGVTANIRTDCPKSNAELVEPKQ